MTRARTTHKLLALFFAAVLLLNYPLISLWNHDAQWFGLPVFPSALFLLWAALIATMAWMLEFGAD